MYLDLVMGLNFGVDLLLLLGADRLAGFPLRLGRVSAAAAVGGVYGGICLLPGFRFLGGMIWRFIFLAIMAVIAFGLNQSVLRRGALFVLLSMALGGIAVGIGKGGLSIIGAAAGLAALSAIGLRKQDVAKQYAAVELRLGEKRRRITALYDTGNTLVDPVTGWAVLVVGADIAREMVGLTMEELSQPIETVAKGSVPGLRLIPYRAVGQPSGMLLAVKMDEVKIGGKVTDMMVAFAPQELGANGIDALAGGIV